MEIFSLFGEVVLCIFEPVLFYVKIAQFLWLPWQRYHFFNFTCLNYSMYIWLQFSKVLRISNFGGTSPLRIFCKGRILAKNMALDFLLALISKND